MITKYVVTLVAMTAAAFAAELQFVPLQDYIGQPGVEHPLAHPIGMRVHQQAGAEDPGCKRDRSEIKEQGVAAAHPAHSIEDRKPYARHAFELIQKVDVRGAPPIWTMLRTAR